MIALRTLRNIVALFILLGSTSCATEASLRISEIRECLFAGADVSLVASCIQPLGYQAKRSQGLPLHWLEDFCLDPNYKNCSHADLLERVDTGSSQITVQPGDRTRADVAIVRNPYVLFSSDAQNLGGNLVMLYVFYSDSDNKVIGWINLGSALQKFDFRAKR